MRVGILDLKPFWKEEAVGQLLPLLSEERKERVMKAARWEDRLRSLGGEYLLGRMLAAEPVAESGCFPLRFQYSPQGKPMLLDFPELSFSLSHSGTVAACVLAKEPVGIDVQIFAGIREKISKRCYTPAEQRFWQAAENEEKAFYQLWSLKESFVKMLGTGLAFSFQQVEFQPLQPGTDGFIDFRVCSETESAAKVSSARVYETGGAYSLAVCASKNESFPDIMESISFAQTAECG